MRTNRHIIVGTAGHVDHGKTELVKALTGVNTDRLKEEQERGISIELGFAEMALPGGDHVGLVDVPGHERFVKAMVAGAAGIDVGLLIVAADESVMPQTREHLDIMQLLGLRAGIVVITKCDLIDDETIQIVEAEIQELVEGTFLQGAPIVRTSARTRQGLDTLLAQLEATTRTLPPRPVDTIFRLPVDRVFTLSGVGVVVTGTAWSGQVREGETVEVLPPGLPARVRSLQVHAEKRAAAFAGERIAMNLHGVKLDEIERGMIVAASGTLHASYMLDTRLSLLPTFGRPLRNRTRLRVHHGAAEVLGRVILLDRDELQPGESALVQLRLESPIAAERGDRLVLRFYSPMHTLGGAQVLDPNPDKHKRHRADVLQEIGLQESADPTALVLEAVRRVGIEGSDAKQLHEARIVDVATLEAKLADLCSGQIARIGARYYATPVVEKAAADVRNAATSFQAANPLAWGIGKAELQARLGHRGAKQHFAELLEHAVQDDVRQGKVHLRPDAVRAGARSRQLADADQKILDVLESRLRDAGLTPPLPADLQKELRAANRWAAFIGLLEEEGRLVRVNESLLYHPSALADVEQRLRGFLGSHDVMSMADFKELTGLSRKYAVPLLEYFDRKGVTRRDGDVRRPGPLARA